MAAVAPRDHTDGLGKVNVTPWLVAQLTAGEALAGGALPSMTGWTFTDEAFAAIDATCVEAQPTAMMRLAATCAGSPFSTGADRRAAALHLVKSCDLSGLDDEAVAKLVGVLQIDDALLLQAQRGRVPHRGEMVKQLVRIVRIDPERFPKALDFMLRTCAKAGSDPWMTALPYGACTTEQLFDIAGTIESTADAHRPAICAWLTAQVGGPGSELLLVRLLEQVEADVFARRLLDDDAVTFDPDVLEYVFHNSSRPHLLILAMTLGRTALLAMRRGPEGGRPRSQDAIERLAELVSNHYDVVELQGIVRDDALMWLIARQLPHDASDGVWMTVCSLADQFEGTIPELIDAAVSMTDR